MTQPLSKYFLAAATKMLAVVDCVGHGSNQHEVTATGDLFEMLGDQPRKLVRGSSDERFDAIYVHVTETDDVIADTGKLSWYDSRANQPHRGPEWRLYYQANDITRAMKPGDQLFIVVLPDRTIGFLACDRDSSFQGLVEAIFRVQHSKSEQMVIIPVSPDTSSPADYFTFQLLDALGIEPDIPPDFDAASVVAQFKGTFPPTATFSTLARETLPGLDPRDDPDKVLLAWIDREEAMFRALERGIVGDRLMLGFLDSRGEPDVDAFLKFSLSVQNRRKSRAGHALMNHFSKILRAFEIPFTPEATTEKKGAADFLFPSEAAYADPGFPSANLRMVAAKTSCKDRWRQVLAEADRIKPKHLLTLQPKISLAQTTEMTDQGIILTLPSPIHSSFQDDQRASLLTVADLLQELASL
ncbi:type II restriction endonuclease [Maricaulis maris]|nr:type II restriction endonuclease [Maricaulis maris]